MVKKRSPYLMEVVRLLADGHDHDGTTMGEQLQLTRSAIWKIIKKLQEYGIKIAAIKGKGYRLLEPLVLLELEKIKPYLVQPIEVDLLTSVTSTNDYPKRYQQAAVKVCLAEQQTRGRGRWNRTWYSPFGRNIYLSCLYPFQKDVSELAGLSLVVSLAIVKALRYYTQQQDIVVKWPNDILYKHQKLSGILVEVQAETHSMSHAVMGVGVNVNMVSDDDREMLRAWTSVREIVGQYVDRNQLCVYLLNQLLQDLHTFAQEGFIPFMSEWMQVDCLMNRAIKLKNMHRQVSGVVTGINAQGHLLLHLADGGVQAFSSGEASVVK